ncbi:hypothetical protein KUK74_003158 [Vibrio parahaemolyticus]|nr:hypothetical protein [Vibrio parahaemolyticus]
MPILKIAKWPQACVLFISLFSLLPATAQDNSADLAKHADLAKQLSNPISNLVSVPFQFNWDTGIGPKEADRVTLNIQPVVPFSLNDDWNIISRTILQVNHIQSTYGAITFLFAQKTDQWGLDYRFWTSLHVAHGY